MLLLLLLLLLLKQQHLSLHPLRLLMLEVMHVLLLRPPAQADGVISAFSG